MPLAQGLVTTDQVRALQSAALAEIRAIAAIAEAGPLSDEDRERIRRAIDRIENYTIPMAREPGPSLGPWWAWALAGAAGFGLGAALV